MTAQGDNGSRPPRVGLVLGAGGVLGAAWLLGGLKALAARTRWDPTTADRLVGTSAGSVMSTYLGAGVPAWYSAARSAGEVFEGFAGEEPFADDPEEILQYKLRGAPSLGAGSWRMVRRARKMPKGRARSAALILGALPKGMVSGRQIELAMRRVVPEGWVDHPSTWITACDYATGERVALGRPPAPEVDIAIAVCASCAVPAFYKPVRIAGKRFIDGGVHSPSNLDLVADQELDLVICLNPMSLPSPKPAPGAKQTRRARLADSLRMNARRCVEREAQAVRAAGKDLVVIEPGEEDLELIGDNMMNRTRRDAVRELAVETVGRQIERPENWDLLCGLPEGAPHMVERPAGAPSEWPALLPARAGAREPAGAGRVTHSG